MPRERLIISVSLITHSAFFVNGTLKGFQGRREEAEMSFIEAHNTWIEGDQPELHPFNGGCLFRIGVCCLDQGKVDAAM